MRYFASVGYLGQKGNIDNFSYKRYNLRTNLETQLAKNFQLSLGIAGNVGKRETPGYASGGTISYHNHFIQSCHIIFHNHINGRLTCYLYFLI
jgi:hypothetical protein